MREFILYSILLALIYFAIRVHFYLLNDTEFNMKELTLYTYFIEKTDNGYCGWCNLDENSLATTQADTLDQFIINAMESINILDEYRNVILPQIHFTFTA